jgi:hypothetical protein
MWKMWEGRMGQVKPGRGPLVPTAAVSDNFIEL